MKYQQRAAILACLMAAGVSLTVMPAMADTIATKPQVNVGRLLMRENKVDGDHKCEIPLTRTNRRVEIRMGNTQCKDDEVYFYRFDNAPSPALITFYDSPDCVSKKKWSYTLRITRYAVTSDDWLAIDGLKDKKKGDKIDNGVYLEDGENEGNDQVGGKLSCVAIDY
ncbi:MULTISPECIES: hypothetical protein [unclassified Pseudomonas]|uniref:hypothetical protein n=1 Tax=unclassified Pseudomonas TaxID=196821 RepID=UPI0024493566|nr:MULTISPECIES: hypothetical protein [unclassified Pseudomonas]MDH0304518.1 hypothetical protein [Pseudomonas sp. GD04091]MDH1985547.1 hypothetical protein [Pseudomonas sp. GD03689]